ncbi:MAG: hypothetical protein IJ030_04235 [Oscillospiraceae bacterium]|nr:hypothetical protein [Oscillospiraceae bacterium]
MKKIFAILLTLVMLLPMAMMPAANAEPTPDKPFYVLGWSDYNNEKFPLMDGLVTSGINVTDENVRFYYGKNPVIYGSYTDADVTAFAQALKADMDARPEGMRYWHLWGPLKGLGLKPEAVIYLDYGVDQMKELMTVIVKKYKEIGGQMDGVVIDTEYLGMSAWDIHSKVALNDPLIYNKIVQDPHYATEVRPLLVERGFEFYPNVTDYTPEIYSISQNTGDKYADARSIWNTAMSIRLKRYLNEWCYEPLAACYPEATLSDYQSTDMAAWLKGINDAGNVVGGAAGNTYRGGNTSNYNFYANRPSPEFYKDSQQQPIFKNPPSYIEAVYEASAYNMFMYNMNLVKRMYASTDTKNLSFWICEHDYDGKTVGTVSNTPYYTEEILHMGLYNPQPFLGYLYDQAFKDENGKVSAEVYDAHCVVINEIMTELTRVAGYSDRKPIEVPQEWNREFVLSGMYCGGRNLWRITPNTDRVSLTDFKVAGEDPTFCVDGQTVTFPGGKIIEDGPISVVGSCGYWVETAENVTPIITNDADRLVKKPAFLEDFESYEVGTKLVTMNVRNPGAWVIQPKGNDLVVEADGDNKVLAITGNSVYQNQHLPANITLADSNAAKQIWELTVTVPAGMTAEESVVLLKYEAGQQKDEDGGFKLSGGKISYMEAGEYKEMKLDISAGGKYTFRREMDLEAFTCNYIVTDAAGKTLVEAEKVAVPEFNGKVNKLGLTCKKVTGKLLLDNFSLRAAGAAADFEIYDAKMGLGLEENAVHNAPVAYRLSWTNVDADEQAATVMAAFYEGETLKEEKVIKEVKMAPGCDGVENGIVEVAEGQSVKVYLKRETPAEKSSADIGLIAGIAAAVVVVVAAIVLALVLIKKKPQERTDNQ